jgi:hypothetical protein
MNDLLFYALLIALLYYFFYYLPQQKKQSLPPPKPFTHQKETQTEKEDNPLPGSVIEFPSAQSQPVNQTDPTLEKTLDQLIKNMQQLNKSLK